MPRNYLTIVEEEEETSQLNVQPFDQENPQEPEQQKESRTSLFFRFVKGFYKVYNMYFLLISFLLILLCGMDIIVVTVYNSFIPSQQENKVALWTSAAMSCVTLSLCCLWSALLTCNLKLIQDQWSRDFEYLKRILKVLVSWWAKEDEWKLQLCGRDWTNGVFYIVLLTFNVVLPLLLALGFRVAPGCTDYYISLYVFFTTISMVIITVCFWIGVWFSGWYEKYKAVKAAYRGEKKLLSRAVTQTFGIDRESLLWIGICIFVLFTFAMVVFKAWLDYFAAELFPLLLIAAVLCGISFREWKDWKAAQVVVLAIVAVLLWILFLVVTISCSFYVGPTLGGAALLLLFLNQLMLTRKTRSSVDKSLVSGATSGPLLVIFVFTFAVLSVALFAFGTAIRPKGDGNFSIAIANASDPIPPGGLEPYPVCDLRYYAPGVESPEWGRYQRRAHGGLPVTLPSDQLGTSNLTAPAPAAPSAPVETTDFFDIIDFAFLSTLAYSIDEHLKNDLVTWFGNKHRRVDFHVKYHANTTVSFYDLYWPKYNTSIIAVRGTETGMDILQDTNIWGEVLVLQTAALFGPFVSLWPTNLTADFVQLAAALKPRIPGTRYYIPLMEYVQKIKPYRKDIILTGHSLGGGLSKLVGAITDVPAITFSAPGITFVSKKYDVPHVHWDELFVTIKPNHDIVPKIDKQEGLVQEIKCPYFFAQCHRIATTTCQLLQTCGDPWGRSLVGCDLPNRESAPAPLSWEYYP